MNYISLLNQFWQLRREVPFSSVEADLYFYLLEISNGLQWKNPFQQSNALIGATLGVSEKTLISARNRLKQHGLIDFTPGVKRTPSTYRLLVLKPRAGNTLENFQPIREECDSESGSVSDSESDSVSGKNTPDIIKHKLNKTKEETANAVRAEASEQEADLLSGQEPLGGGEPGTVDEPPPPPGKTGKKSRASPLRASPAHTVPPLAERYGQEVAALSEEDRAVWDRFAAWEQHNPLPKLFQMIEPLRPGQLAALTRRYSAEAVADVLRDMQNKPKLLTQYDSANLTAHSWLKRRQQ